MALAAQFNDSRSDPVTLVVGQVGGQRFAQPAAGDVERGVDVRFRGLQRLGGFAGRAAFAGDQHDHLALQRREVRDPGRDQTRQLVLEGRVRRVGRPGIDCAGRGNAPGVTARSGRRAGSGSALESSRRGGGAREPVHANLSSGGASGFFRAEPVDHRI